MLQGVQFKANPTQAQKQVLSQWMGCARLIWNAKCDEERYHTTFARKYCPIGTYAPKHRVVHRIVFEWCRLNLPSCCGLLMEDALLSRLALQS